jgi:hypothetical protein
VSGWAQVETRLWQDPAYVELGPDARLLFLWSWTSPDAAIGGLYVASMRQLGRALSPAYNAAVARRIEAAIDELARKPLLAYDFDTETVWLVNRARHSMRSPKVRVAIAREYERVPEGPLKLAFVMKYGQDLGIPLPILHD